MPCVALPLRVSDAAWRRRDPGQLIHGLQGLAFGTGWRVRFAAPPAFDPEQLRPPIEARLAGIAAEMSQWEPDSLLSRFNRGEPGSFWSLPPDLHRVIAAALHVAERSGGAFDPTLGRAAALHGFGAEPVRAPPTATQLDGARAHAGWRRLRFDVDRGLCQPGGLWLDLSGIAKGFAVDAVADVLADHGRPDVLVEIGGELVGRGLRPDGQPWWVAVEAPPDRPLAPLSVGLHDLAVATSGDYVRGAHTLHPGTGRPVARDVVAVTVVAGDAMRADAWATALTVLGAAPGLAMAAREGLAARIVSVSAGEAISPALAAMLA